MPNYFCCIKVNTNDCVKTLTGQKACNICINNICKNCGRNNTKFCKTCEKSGLTENMKITLKKSFLRRH